MARYLLSRKYKEKEMQALSSAWLARTYLEREKYTKAKNMLLKASEIRGLEDEVLAEVYLVFADFHLRQGELKEAKEKFTEKKPKKPEFKVLAKEVDSEKAEKIKEKNPGLEAIDETASVIGVGAVIFSQLSVRRQKDVDFSWEATDRAADEYDQFLLNIQMHAFRSTSDALCPPKYKFTLWVNSHCLSGICTQL